MDFEPLAEKVVAMRDVDFVVHVRDRHALIQSNDPQDGLSGGMYLGGSIQPRGEQTRSLNRHEFLAHDVASSSWTGEITVKEMLRVVAIAFGGAHLMKPTRNATPQSNTPSASRSWSVTPLTSATSPSEHSEALHASSRKPGAAASGSLCDTGP